MMMLASPGSLKMIAFELKYGDHDVSAQEVGSEVGLYLGRNW